MTWNQLNLKKFGWNIHTICGSKRKSVVICGRLRALSCKALQEFKCLLRSSVWIAQLVKVLTRKAIGQKFESPFSHLIWPRGIKVSDRTVESNGIPTLIADIIIGSQLKFPIEIHLFIPNISLVHLSKTNVNLFICDQKIN